MRISGACARDGAAEPGVHARHGPPRRFDCVIHFAGRKYVNESVENPLRYYDHNVLGTVNLCKTMNKWVCLWW